MKAINIFFIFLGLMVLAAVAAIAKTFVKNKSGSDANYLPTSGSTGSASIVLDYYKSLGFGSKGPEVKEMQRLYNLSAYASTKLVEDGSFGSKTASALVKVMGFGVLSTTLTAFNAKLNSKVVDEKTKGFLASLGLKS